MVKVWPSRIDVFLLNRIIRGVYTTHEGTLQSSLLPEPLLVYTIAFIDPLPEPLLVYTITFIDLRKSGADDPSSANDVPAVEVELRRHRQGKGDTNSKRLADE